jgi:hypothetical protein
MIDISTTLDMQATGFERDYVTKKQVVMRMDADDAFAIATILFNNYDQVSEDWRKAINATAQGLLKAGNRCR